MRAVCNARRAVAGALSKDLVDRNHSHHQRDGNQNVEHALSVVDADYGTDQVRVMPAHGTHTAHTVNEGRGDPNGSLAADSSACLLLAHPAGQ